MAQNPINDRTTTPPTGNNDNLLLTALIALKWKYYRDIHYKLYEATKDIEGYKNSISLYQQILKAWMQKNNQKIVEAITEICKHEDDAITKIKFICAGYDLAGGHDYDCR